MNMVRLAMLRTCVSKAGEQPLVRVIGASYVSMVMSGILNIVTVSEAGIYE